MQAGTTGNALVMQSVLDKADAELGKMFPESSPTPPSPAVSENGDPSGVDHITGSL
jgi:hypothetical protein